MGFQAKLQALTTSKGRGFLGCMNRGAFPLQLRLVCILTPSSFLDEIEPSDGAKKPAKDIWASGRYMKE